MPQHCPSGLIIVWGCVKVAPAMGVKMMFSSSHLSSHIFSKVIWFSFSDAPIFWYFVFPIHCYNSSPSVLDLWHFCLSPSCIHQQYKCFENIVPKGIASKPCRMVIKRSCSVFQEALKFLTSPCLCHQLKIHSWKSPFLHVTLRCSSPAHDRLPGSSCTTLLDLLFIAIGSWNPISYSWSLFTIALL